MKTINHLIAGSFTKYGNRAALGMAFEEALTYAQLEERVRNAAIALVELGIKRGDRLAILSENNTNWGISYLAIVRLGAVCVPILPDFTESDVHHILKGSGAKVLFTNSRQLEKIYELAGHSLKAIITLDDSTPENSPVAVESFADFLTRARGVDERGAAKIAALAGRVKHDDLASIIYTSGTSGHSKAVMLTHGNLVSNVKSANQVIDINPDWVFLSILPMSHTYEFTIGFLLALDNGCRVVYAGARPTPTILQKICAREHPTVACVVPMVMEKIYKKRVLPVLEKNRLLKLAIKVPAIRNRIYQKIGRKLLDFFGGRLELLAIGGAALNREVEEFMVQARFPYIVGYGLTETAPLLAAGPHKDPTIAVGSAGKPVPQVEIKIVNPDLETGIGDIMARGPNITPGYYNNEEETAKAIDADGWFATGDLGYLDGHNNLFIKGRSKSVIVLSHGENIYPEGIEDKLNSYRHVVESLIVPNNGRLEAWIYLDYDLIDQETQGKSQAQQKEYIEELLERMRREVNLLLPQFSQISKCVERQEPFIKTATHKIKRYLYTG